MPINKPYSLHRARQGFVRARSAQANQIRGLLAEYGITLPQGICHVAKRLPAIVDDGENGLPDTFRQLLDRLRTHLIELDRQVQELELQIHDWHSRNEGSQKLTKIPGIGSLTASALIASKDCKGTCQRIPSGTEAVASIQSPDLWLQSLPAYRH